MGKHGTPHRTAQPSVEPGRFDLSQGACHGIDPDVFVPASPSADVSEAKAVCARCPVVNNCLDWAFQIGDDWAVLGGTTPAERRTMRRRHAAGVVNANGPVRACALTDCGQKFIVERRKPDQRYCNRTCSARANARARHGARELVAA
jgi:WhiB family redox-sensing transcriptional regulator